MGALALGIVLIIGYFYQNTHPYRRLELIRSTGYHIYFKAGFSGFIFLIAAVITWGIIDYYDIPSAFIDAIKQKSELSYLQDPKHWNNLKAFAVFTLMFLFSMLTVAIGYLFNTKAKSLAHVKQVAHELELLVINATTGVTPIRLELDCGKVYVGIPETPNLEKGEVKYITILPLLSGFLNDEKKIIFNNNYYLHYKEHFTGQKQDNGFHHKTIREFSIVIPVEQIVVASGFDIDAFIEFRKNADSELLGS